MAITFKLTGTLRYEPRPGQMSLERQRQSTREWMEREKDRRGEESPIIAASLARLENRPACNLGTLEDGRRTTGLTLDVDGKVVEVSCVGPLAEKVAMLDPGAQLSITGQVRPDSGYLYLRAARVTVLEPVHA